MRRAEGRLPRSNDVEPVADEKLLAILNNHYLFLMEDQLDTNRFGRTKELLERHRTIGVEPSLVYYFYGEMFRQRLVLRHLHRRWIRQGFRDRTHVDASPDVFAKTRTAFSV